MTVDFNIFQGGMPPDTLEAPPFPTPGYVPLMSGFEEYLKIRTKRMM